MFKSNLNFFRIIICLMIVLFGFSGLSLARKAKGHGYRVSAKAAILSDSTNQKRLYGRNVHLAVAPASTAKVMTALLVLEKLSLNSYVTIGPRATYVQPTKLNLRSGERYKVSDLVYAAIINSANDAAVALAEATAGSESKFVALMNKRAKQLGAKHTKFVNSTGLPSRLTQHTSAYDMYLIFREALKHPFFAQAIEYRYKTIYSEAGRKISFKSHNKMLFLGWRRDVYGKTGYTRAAQSCFVGTVNDRGRRLIVAVFGCSRRWDDIRYLMSHFGGVRL